MNINRGNSENFKITCPQCSELIFGTSNRNNNINNNNNNRINTPCEFMKFNCQKCTINFCYILCAFCDKKIYMKIHPEGLDYNGLNGFNINCPYNSCGKSFYFTKCIKCKRTQKIKNYIKEGSTITCIYKDCKFEYFQINCPIKYCPDLISNEKPKLHKNFPFGVMCIHKKEHEVMYQKVNCFYCWRPIVYLSSVTHKNKYIECQKVICPYNDCKKSFNRIICPHCYSENYFNDGWYKMGSKIKCNKCQENFGKILCPSCGKINICEGKYFKSGLIKCGFQNCLKENYMVNCIYCRKLNVFNQLPINGQKIKCGYCQNTFNEVICPFCSLINPFPLSDFCYGKIYKCKYLNCLKEFQFLMCPKCFLYTFEKDHQEGRKLKCDECNTLFMNWGCPFCKSNIMDKDSNLNLGQMVKCPAKHCRKEYSFIKCIKCQKLIFSKENESLLGKCVKCPYQDCEESFLINICPQCNKRLIYSGRIESYNEGNKIKCPNCKKSYRFKRNKNLYEKKLIILEEIVGETINFGIGEIDENYLFKQNLIFQIKKNAIYPSQNIDIISEKTNSISFQNKSLADCMVCHNNLKESIFYPCGHRCVCYNCALLIFEVDKKCPKCKIKAKCIIRKIYE